MITLRCCVIDDEPLAARLIGSYVERTPFLSLEGVYNSATDAARPIISGEIDLVFLDIEMPQLGGMEFAKIIPETCKVVFTTAYDRYAVQGFRVNALDYLLKPVSYDEFLEAANRAVKEATARVETPVAEPAPAQRREFIVVKSEYRMLQIRVSDIRFVEGLKDYVKIYIAGQSRPVLTLMSMKAVEDLLCGGDFLRVHRSYLVNTRHISVIERNHLVIADCPIPISDSYRKAFADYLASLS